MKTAEALYQEFGTKHPRLIDVASKYLGITDESVVSKRALKGDLGGIKPFRLGTRKSPWLCDVDQLADVLDRVVK